MPVGRLDWALFCHYLLGLVCTCILFLLLFFLGQFRTGLTTTLVSYFVIDSTASAYISTWLLDLVSKNRFGYVSVSGSALALLSRQ